MSYKSRMSQSASTRLKHENEEFAFMYNYLKSPAGKMGMKLLEKLENRKFDELYEVPDLLYKFEDEIREKIYMTDILDRNEKYALYEFLNKFDIYKLKAQLKSAKGNRNELVNYKNRMPEEYEDEDIFSTLERKKKSSKSKPKRKVTKKVVKKCKCK